MSIIITVFLQGILEDTRIIMVKYQVGNQANGGEVAHTFVVIKISFSRAILGLLRCLLITFTTYYLYNSYNFFNDNYQSKNSNNY